VVWELSTARCTARKYPNGWSSHTGKHAAAFKVDLSGQDNAQSMHRFLPASLLTHGKSAPPPVWALASVVGGRVRWEEWWWVRGTLSALCLFPVPCLRYAADLCSIQCVNDLQLRRQAAAYSATPLRCYDVKQNA